MKNKLRRDIFVIIFLLLVACIALAVPLASCPARICSRKAGLYHTTEPSVIDRKSVV